MGSTIRPISVESVVLVLHVHPLVVLPSLLDLLLTLTQLSLDLRHCLLDFLVQDLSTMSLLLGALVVLLQELLAGGPLVELEGAVSEHIDGLNLIAGIVVQLLKDFSGFAELLHLHKVLPQSCQSLRFVLLSLLLHPLVKLHQQYLRSLELVPPHQVVGSLQPYIHAEGVYLLPAIHRFQAFPLRIPLLQQIGQADLSNTGVGLCNISLNFRFRSSGLERIGQAFLGGFDASFEGLDGLHAMIDVCQFHEAFVGAGGDFLDIAFQDLLCFLLLLGDLEEVGVAHDQHLILGVFGVGQAVEVFCIFVVQ